MPLSSRTRGRAFLALTLAFALVLGVSPWSAYATRDGQTTFTETDADHDGKPEKVEVDWDGDGTNDEVWNDPDEDGDIDSTAAINTGGDTSRSPRMKPGGRIRSAPLSGGGGMLGVDWNGDGRYDEVWWDFDGDGRVDDTDTYETESKVVDNTKSTRFRAVMVGVKNGLDYPEKDVEDLSQALGQYPASWGAADMNKLLGADATPANIQAGIDAAKASSQPGDEFLFYFSGHGGGWNREKGKMGGGFIDADGDETANSVPESDFGRFDGSGLPTATPGNVRCYPKDLDGDGVRETEVVKDADGQVEVWRKIGATWVKCGEDLDGDGDVDKDDGGVDVNGDGDKDDKVGIDDTILVAGRTQISDDTLAQWLSGFPESVTIVVIIDACHSGSFTNDVQRVKDDKGKPLRPGHLELIAAAAWDEVAIEKGISNGVLTQGILDGLHRLPDWLTGGHSTSIADFVGNNDDRTTTAELAEWCGPAAVTYLAKDDDGDGLRNEDGVDCGLYVPPYTEQATIGVDGPASPGGPEHIPDDEDGDGETDEDVRPPAESFFDVYCDPEFGSDGTPRLLNYVSGDEPFDITGLGPAISIYSDTGIEPGTPSVPGPTLRVGIRQMPVPHMPPLVVDGVPMEYASDMYDISVDRVVQSHGLDEVSDTVAPSKVVEPVGAGGHPTLKVVLKGKAGVPLGDSIPVMFNPEPIRVSKPATWTKDHTRGTTEFAPEPGFKWFALASPAPHSEQDTTPPDPPVVRSILIEEPDRSAGVPGKMRAAWSRPTDPDFEFTRVMYSTVAFPTDPDDPASVVVTDSPDNDCDDALSTPGTRYYSLFARDWAGNWSEPAHAVASLRRLQGADPGITWSGPWFQLLRTQFIDGSANYASSSQAYCLAAFEGTGVELVGARTTSSGYAHVYLDGLLVSTVDLYASPNRFRQTVYAVSGLPPGPHTLRVKPAGRKNVRSVGYNVFVDAFEVYEAEQGL